MKTTVDLPGEFDLARLRQRLDGYLVNHQVGLHTTVMSIALAVGGIALASLLGTARLYRDQYPLLWMLWLASMLACFVVYNSVSTSAYALPPKIPSASDLVPPLAIGAFEFLLFAVLAHQATGLNRTSSVIEAWFLSFAGFALTSVGALIRADYLFKTAKYEERLRCAITELRKVLHLDTAAAAFLAVVALVALVAGVEEAYRRIPSAVLYIIAGAIILGLLIAPLGHAHRVAVLRRVLAEDDANGDVPGSDGLRGDAGRGQQTREAGEHGVRLAGSELKVDAAQSSGKRQTMGNGSDDDKDIDPNPQTTEEPTA